MIIGFLLVQVSIALQVLPGGAGLAEVGLLGSLAAAGVDVGGRGDRGWHQDLSDLLGATARHFLACHDK